jgi:hypothetical protein
MKSSPESEFERLDRAIANIRDSLWHYRFVHQELDLDRYKSGTPLLPTAARARVLALMKSLSETAQELQAAAHAFEARLSEETYDKKP